MTYQLDPSMHEWTKYERLILFDGVCNWCNAWVSVTIAHDPAGKFKFGTLRSEQAQRILRDLNFPANDYQTPSLQQIPLPPPLRLHRDIVALLLEER